MSNSNQDLLAEAIDNISKVIRTTEQSLHCLDWHPTGDVDMDDAQRARAQKRANDLTAIRAGLEAIYARYDG